MSNQIKSCSLMSDISLQSNIALQSVRGCWFLTLLPVTAVTGHCRFGIHAIQGIQRFDCSSFQNIDMKETNFHILCQCPAFEETLETELVFIINKTPWKWNCSTTSFITSVRLFTSLSINIYLSTII